MQTATEAFEPQTSTTILPARRAEGRTLAATLAIASLLLLALEILSPYYFLQDDGLELFLPYYVHNWRSLLAGKLPLYDFHMFAGVPHLAIGQAGVFYVPEYLAMFLSKTIWGHPFAAIDLMAFMHALIAVAGGYVLLRHLGAGNLAASFGALTALSGFFVWAGRMWPVALMLCAWFPWMVWAALRYLQGPGVGRAGWLMFFRLGLLYGGQAQFFVLAMIFEHLFALSHSLATRQAGWKKRCAGYLALDVPTALLGLPYLLPVWAEVGGSLARARPLAYAQFSILSMHPLFWVFGQLFVFVQLHLAKDVVGFALPYLSYIGYFATFLSLGAGVLWKKQPRSRPWIVASGVCFLIALLWCWNVIGPLIYQVPVLNRFRWPFKLVYFAGFFQCMVAAMVLTLWSRRWQRIAIAGFLLNWVVVFCFLPNHAWHIQEYHPPLKTPWRQSLKDGRYFVIIQGAIRSVSKQFVEFNYAEMWGLDDFLGRETLLPRLNARVAFRKSDSEPDLESGTYNGPVDQPLLDHLKKWGVKYVLVGPNRPGASAKLAGAGFEAQTVKQGWTLWEDPSALSRVRWDNRPPGSDSEGIRWVEHVNSIDVHLSQWPGRRLVFAFVANPGLETCIARECSAVRGSPDGLIRMEVPAGTRHVRLVYHSALLSIALWVALATLAGYVLLLLRSLRGERHESGG